MIRMASTWDPVVTGSALLLAADLGIPLLLKFVTEQSPG